MSDKSNITELFPWITTSFVQSLIQKSEENRRVILKWFTAKKCFNDGENFSSYMVALKTSFQDENDGDEIEKDILLKIAIQTEEFKRICEECLVFEREIAAYTQVLPAVRKLYETIGLTAEIAPRCYLGDIDRRLLAFEDLRNQQFKPVNSANGLDIEHMQFTLSHLAKWHAGTATLLLTNIELFEWYTGKIVYEHAPMVQAFFKSIAKNVSNTCKNWPGFEAIAEKLVNVPQHVYDNMYKSFMPQPDGFNVITHGDMFINNLLFKYDSNGKPIDLRFVDFALSKHVNPSIDLVCLLYGSSHSSIKQRDREHLIQYYHSNLVKNLKLLEFPGKIPTLLDIQTATFRVDLYNALVVLFIIGLRYVDKFHEGGFVDVANDENGKLYSHPRCIEELKYLLDLFNRRGYFDFE